MSRPHQLIDAQWGLIEPLFSYRGRMGSPQPGSVPDARCYPMGSSFGGVMAGHPRAFGPWNKIYDTFHRWQKVRLIDAIVERLQLRLNEEGKIDFDQWCLDSSNVRASQDAAGARNKHAGPAEPGLGAFPRRFWYQNSPGDGR